MANAPSKQYQHGGGKFNLILFCCCNCLSLLLLLNVCFWWFLFFLLFSSTTAQHAADCCFLHNPLHFHWYCPSLSSLFLVLVSLLLVFVYGLPPFCAPYNVDFWLLLCCYWPTPPSAIFIIVTDSPPTSADWIFYSSPLLLPTLVKIVACNCHQSCWL